jgi:putative RecB family exonuclease
VPFALPRSLSPSKVSSFTDCPLAFRFSIIDRLPEPPSPHQVRGTLVHAALERLVWHNVPEARDLPTARTELLTAWDAMQGDPELVALGLSDEESQAFVDEAWALVQNYFRLEDPRRVRAVGVELGLEADLGSTRLRGIIDRLDVNEDGGLVVIDYKTGRAPSPRFEHGRLSGVHLYALLCERVLGRKPDEVRLLYLRDPLTITAMPSEQSVRGQGKRAQAVWAAIERACTTGDFRPRSSPLCSHCHFQALCPAFGGEPPIGPSLIQPQLAEATVAAAS